MLLDIVTLGEIMLRFSAPPPQVLEQASYFEVRAAGAESNVAIIASRMGMRTGWISRLPDNPLSRRAVRSVQEHGVDTSRVVWASSGRIGTYYIDLGVTPRSDNIVYDRGHSAITELAPDEVDWDYVRAARIFHVTGITPALSAILREVVSRALTIAKSSGIQVSFDFNYRAKLWSPDEARLVIEPLLSSVDILRAGIDEVCLVLGLNGDAESVARALHKQYGARVVVITDGSREVVAYDGKVHRRTPYAVNVVDAIGAGDAFTAGFLTGFLEGGVGSGLDMALALGALKYTYVGDIPWCTREQVVTLIERRQDVPR